MSFHALDAEYGVDIGKRGETVLEGAFAEDDRRQTPSAGSKYLKLNAIPATHKHPPNVRTNQLRIVAMNVGIKKLHPASGRKWTAPALTLAAHAGRLLEPQPRALDHWVSSLSPALLWLLLLLDNKILHPE